jgi:hypothetical protein
MGKFMMFVAVCAVSSTANAANADYFDLVCTGQQQLATGKPAVAWKERLRFDLMSKRWCRGTCKVASEISQITADEISIYDSRANAGGPADVQLTLSRSQGTIREAVAAGWSGSAFAIAEGTCVREQFSGLPGQKF